MTLATPPISPTHHHRFTADQYHLMVESGVFASDDRVEFINGEIVDMSPIGKEQAGIINLLVAFLRFAGDSAPLLSVQNPILLNDHSEPQPDLAVLRFRADYYRKSLSRPEDVLLLIEVADSSLIKDRRIKIPLYARAGIPEVWIVDLSGRSLDVFRTPSDDQYLQVQTLKRPASIAPIAFASHTLSMTTLFPD